MRKNILSTIACLLVLNLAMGASAEEPIPVPPAADEAPGFVTMRSFLHAEEAPAVPEEIPAEVRSEPVAPGRLFYSSNGIYSRIVLFDTHRETANESLPFYSSIGKYTNEVLYDDPDMLREDREHNPNMWPWRTWHSEPPWSVLVEHPQGNSAEHGSPRPHAPINWKSFESYQLMDFATRKNKADQVNSMLADQPELHRSGVDWKEHPWPQLHEMSRRLYFAERLKTMGVKIDYRQHTPEQMLNFLSRMKLAQKLDKLGCHVHWRLYSWRQLHDLLRRAKRSDALLEEKSEV